MGFLKNSLAQPIADTEIAPPGGENWLILC